MIGRYIFSIGASAALLAGCGGSQPLFGAPATMPQTVARNRNETGKGPLLYVTSNTDTYAWVYMYSFPQGKLVGKIAKQINGLCSDSHGNVYMTQSYNSTSKIFEYAHAGKKPIVTLSDPDNGAAGCAIDPVTGALAVANSQSGTVLIYQHARGKPKRYYIWIGPRYVAYDPEGHLYALGSKGNEFALLSGGLFRRVQLNKHLNYTMGLQWDGSYMALGGVASYSVYYYYGLIDRYTLTNRKGAFEGTTVFSTDANSFFVDGSVVVTSDYNSDRVRFFAYPAGGSPTKTLNVDSPGSLTVSLAP